MSQIAGIAVQNLGATLAIAMEHTANQRALVVADEQSELSRLMLQAYRVCLPEAQLLSFDVAGPVAVKAAFAELREQDLEVLIQ